MRLGNRRWQWSYHSKVVVFLGALLFLLDLVYTPIYLKVDVVRALLISLSAFIVLSIPWAQQGLGMTPWMAFLPILVSTVIGSFLVRLGDIIPGSLMSGILHFLLIVVTYFVIDAAYHFLQQERF